MKTNMLSLMVSLMYFWVHVIGLWGIMYIMYLNVFGFCHQIVDVCQSHDLTSSIHDDKKDQRPKEETKLPRICHTKKCIKHALYIILIP